jgi:hypothetical protein
MEQFTVTGKALAQEMEKHMSPQESAMVARVYVAAMKAVFSPQTHGQVMGEIDSEISKQGIQKASSVLGAEVSHIMQLVYGQAKGLPPAALIPAGVLLLARICTFYDKSAAVQITDKIFGDAAHMLVTTLRDKFEPGFRQKIGMQPQQAEQKQAQQQAPIAPPAQGGMLATGGQ